ncbi:hypothetical protein [Cloacibacillus evryensis]|nr:hypothetical protein [Cloacibacillus evryensis]
MLNCGGKPPSSSIFASQAFAIACTEIHECFFIGDESNSPISSER